MMQISLQEDGIWTYLEFVADAKEKDKEIILRDYLFPTEELLLDISDLTYPVFQS